MCNLLGIKRITYYKALNKPQSPRKIENTILKEEISNIYIQNPNLHNPYRVHKALTNDHHNISLKRVQKLMNEMGLIHLN